MHVPGEDKATVSGTASQIAAARAHLEQVIEQAPRGTSALTVDYQIPLSEEDARRVIGKGGRNINELRAATKLNLVVKPGLLQFRGRPEQHQQVLAFIASLSPKNFEFPLEPLIFLRTFESKLSETFQGTDITYIFTPIPNGLSKLIGKGCSVLTSGGEHISLVRAGSRAQVLIPPRAVGQPAAPVTLKGSFVQIWSALHLISADCLDFHNFQIRHTDLGLLTIQSQPGTFLLRHISAQATEKQAQFLRELLGSLDPHRGLIACVNCGEFYDKAANDNAACTRFAYHAGRAKRLEPYRRQLEDGGRETVTAVQPTLVHIVRELEGRSALTTGIASEPLEQHTWFEEYSCCGRVPRDKGCSERRPHFPGK